jgi:hypothetical protein
MPDRRVAKRPPRLIGVLAKRRRGRPASAGSSPAPTRAEAPHQNPNDHNDRRHHHRAPTTWSIQLIPASSSSSFTSGSARKGWAGPRCTPRRWDRDSARGAGNAPYLLRDAVPSLGAPSGGYASPSLTSALRQTPDVSFGPFMRSVIAREVDGESRTWAIAPACRSPPGARGQTARLSADPGGPDHGILLRSDHQNSPGSGG